MINPPEWLTLRVLGKRKRWMFGIFREKTQRDFSKMAILNRFLDEHKKGPLTPPV